MAPIIQDPSEQDVDAFIRRLDAFASTLPSVQQHLVHELLAGATATNDGVTTEASACDELPPPSEQDLQAFRSQLDGFHASLPPGEHQVFDAIVARAADAEATQLDVQGYTMTDNKKPNPHTILPPKEFARSGNDEKIYKKIRKYNAKCQKKGGIPEVVLSPSLIQVFCYKQ